MQQGALEQLGRRAGFGTFFRRGEGDGSTAEKGERGREEADDKGEREVKGTEGGEKHAQKK